MEQFSTIFLSFIDTWGYVAVAVLMGLENACIPIPSELILGFAGYLIFAGKMEFFHATVAGMIGGMVGSIITYYIGAKGGRPFVDKYGKYFFMKKSHVDTAQEWFDKYGIKAVFFSRLLPVVRYIYLFTCRFCQSKYEKNSSFTHSSVPFLGLCSSYTSV